MESHLDTKPKQPTYADETKDFHTRFRRQPLYGCIERDEEGVFMPPLSTILPNPLLQPGKSLGACFSLTDIRGIVALVSTSAGTYDSPRRWREFRCPAGVPPGYI
jgi:hypothetical protein